MNNRNSIRFDWAIKRLLRNKANFSVLEGFLSELLKEDVQIQNILESENNEKLDSDKYNRIDILVKNYSQHLKDLRNEASRILTLKVDAEDSVRLDEKRQVAKWLKAKNIPV